LKIVWLLVGTFSTRSGLSNRWQDAVADETEARVALHTRRSLVSAIVDRAHRDHPYDVPCVIAMPIVDGNPAYVDWVLRETLNGHEDKGAR